LGTIAPEIYGHFVEHLGGVVYDGSWVGENSPIPNVNGLRKQLVDALKRIKPGSGDPRAHNTFEDPRAVEPKALTVTLKGAGIVHQFPPASVTKLTFTLG
jgi:alpha-L-arabinofuranosidase